MPMDCSTENACTIEWYCEETLACLSDQGDNMTKKDQQVSQDAQRKLCSEKSSIQKSAKKAALVLKKKKKKKKKTLFRKCQKSSPCVKKTVLVIKRMSRARLCHNNNINNTSFVNKRLREAKEAMRGKQRVRKV